MKFDEFSISNGDAYSIVKQDLKNGKNLDNFCSKEVLKKNIET